MQKEIWNDIQGYEGYYKVSNLGRVKSLDRYITYCDGKTVLTKGKLLNGFKKSNGYMSIDLYKNKKKRKYHIHRLVAIAFVPNPSNKPIINHKDENRSNNIFTNLEWCTTKENLNYGNCKEKLRKAHINHPNISKSISQYDLNNNLIKIYPSAREVERQTGYPATSITRNCKCKTRTCHGYIWRYTKDGVA